jgi:hypothetical protein
MVMTLRRNIERVNAPVAPLIAAASARWGYPVSRDVLTFAPRRAFHTAIVTLATLALALAILVLAGHFQLSQAQAQEHNHPLADAPLHEKFYSTWMMPDKPERSCCNKQDCYPTEVRYRDGFWEARRREDGRYVRVPWEKIEQRRDNPDGRSHVCMAPPARSLDGAEVFCFALGAGT